MEMVDVLTPHAFFLLCVFLENKLIILITSSLNIWNYFFTSIFYHFLECFRNRDLYIS